MQFEITDEGSRIWNIIVGNGVLRKVSNKGRCILALNRTTLDGNKITTAYGKIIKKGYSFYHRLIFDWSFFIPVLYLGNASH